MRVPWPARRSNQSILKEIIPEYSWKDWCWNCNSNILPTWCEELTHWKRPWFLERLKVGGEGDDRRCDCWMASPTQWTWDWVRSRSWWWSGRPGVLQSMGVTKSQTRLSDWTELNWTKSTKSTPLGCLLQNLKTLGFQGETKPKRLTYYSHTVWPQYWLENRSQWSEKGTLNYSTLWDLGNVCHHNASGQRSLLFRLSSLSALGPLSVLPVLLLRYF